MLVELFSRIVVFDTPIHFNDLETMRSNLDTSTFKKNYLLNVLFKKKFVSPRDTP